MSIHAIEGKSLIRLNELADLQHPHLKGNNHTRKLIEKCYKKEPLTSEEAFDCGKYYQRMLNQLKDFDSKSDLHGEYLHAILDFKWSVK